MFWDKKYHDLQFENSNLKEELKRIKPIVESKDYKPALSKDCGDCKFCVRSPWNDDIIGCRKDNVCADFESYDGLVYYTDKIIKYKPKKMTIEEIEQKLGYKIEIVSNKKEK